MSPESSGDGRPDRREYALLVIGLLFAVITIWLGSYGELWATLDPRLRGSLTVAVSMFFTLGGFLLASYVQRGRLSQELVQAKKAIIAQQRQTKREIIAQQRQAKKDIIQQQAHSPQIDAITVYTGTEGMEHITRLVLQAKVALNTIILPRVEDLWPKQPIMEDWDKAVILAVQNSTCFRDVASEACERFVIARASALSGMDYGARVVPSTIEAFPNFIVLEYQDSTKEVWFGWTRPSPASFSQRCFRCRESEVVAFFEKLHDTLFESGLGDRDPPLDTAAARTKS